MKKRRQLDALVSNGKLPRKKSKSGHELLRSNDSDSSEVEEFSQTFDKKGCFRSINCSACSPFLILIVLFTLMACIVASAGLIWMHFELKRDLDNLRDRIIAVESENKKDNEDVIKLQSDFNKMNKSIEIIKKENLNLKMNLTQLAIKYKKLTDKSSSLTQNLKSITNLNKLTQIDSLSKTLSALGSDFKTLKSEVNPKLEDIIKRVSELENKKSVTEALVTKTVVTPPPYLTDIPQSLTSINNDIDILNKTMIEIDNYIHSNITDKVSELVNTVNNIDTVTISKHTEGGNTSSKQQISQIIQEMIKNKEITLLGDTEAMSTLLNKVNNLTTTVEELKSNHSQILSDHSVMSLKNPEMAELTLQTQKMNKTLNKLDTDFDTVVKKLTSNSNKLHIVSSTVEGLQKYMAMKENISLLLDNTTTQLLQTPSLVTTTAPSKPVIKITGVTTYSDLEAKYGLWNKDGGNIHDLTGFMPSAKAETLMSYDTNKDGLSIEELSGALGITKPESNIPADLQNL